MEKAKEAFILVCFSLVAITLIAGLTYGGWQLSRYINWEFGYEDSTEKTIQRMVKKECLKETK